MLVDDAWCELFLRHAISVGVSLDGPAFLHDARRRTRTGAGTHAAAMRGVAALSRHLIRFHAICVVTRAMLDHPDSVVDFFAEHNIEEVGLNIEEIEGVNARSSLSGADTRARFRHFFDRVMDRAIGAGLRIREIRTILGALAQPAAGNDENTPFRIVTVTHDGALHTFSPELAGTRHPTIGSLSFGRVGDATLGEILDAPKFRAVWSEIREGIQACSTNCSYFPLCRGGAPANKLAELGTFAGTETMACSLGHQEIAEAVLFRILDAARRDASGARRSLRLR
jgi:uncharacterized protein